MNALTLSVVVVLIASGAVRASFDFEKAEKVFNVCKAETKAEESFEEVYKKEVIPKSENGKCLVECLLKARGIIDKDGEYSKEGTKKYFSQLLANKSDIIDKVIAIADECSKIGDDKNKCQAAVNHIACAKDKYIEQKLAIYE